MDSNCAISTSIQNPPAAASMDQACCHEATFTDNQGHLRTSRVPSVQELARQGLDHLPTRFVHPDLDPHQSIAPDLDLPCISVAKLRGGAEGRARELERLAAGARDWGMFMIKDHTIASDEVKDVVKGFFGLSFQDKKASVGSYPSTDNMGYGRNFVKSEDRPLSWLDRLAMKAAPAGSTQGLHVWPLNPSNFRQVMEKYAEEARSVLNELLEALAEAFSLQRQVFVESFDSEESEINVRINYYPPCPRPDLALGTQPHSDGSALTLLMQFGSNGGLQVLKGQKWVCVPWQEEALLVSIGDLMEIMSNGRVESPWHRVVTQKDTERFSVALFYNPPSKAHIRPVEGDDHGDEFDQYKEVCVGDYLKHLYEISTTTIDKRAIMFAKNQGLVSPR